MYNTDSLRNLGIIAHVDAGKTTLSERILFNCGLISTMGEVSSGTTVMDFLPEERERGITVESACISVHWKDVRINLVDTPGHVDFSAEVERTLAVIDGCVVVFSGVDGVEAQSEMVWRVADRNALPRLVFINKLDRTEADYKRVLTELEERLGVRTLLLTLPLLREVSDAAQTPLAGVVDVLTGEVLHSQDAFSDAVQEAAAREREAAMTRLLETLADVDEAFMTLWADDRQTQADIVEAVRSACLARTLVPVFCGAARANLGVTQLLDGIATFLPDPDQGLHLRSHAGCALFSPDELAGISEANDCAAFVWKVVHTASQRFAWLRLYAGSLVSGDLLMAGKDRTKAGAVSVFRIDAEQVLALPRASSGDIVACTGPSFATGESVSKSGTPLRLALLNNASPVLSQTIEPQKAEDYPRLTSALAKKADEDPSLHVEIDEATGSCLVSGQGELHLNVLLDTLIRELGLALHAQKPRVVCRERVTATITASAECALENPPLFGRVRISLVPTAPGSGLTLTLQDPPPQGIEPCALKEALLSHLHQGGHSTWPLCDLCVRVEALAMVSERCTLDGMRLAFANALQKALAQARNDGLLEELEPVMRLELFCPDDVLGSLLNQLAQVHAKVLQLDESHSQYALRSVKHVLAEAALQELLEFPTQLRSATQGRCELFLTFARFARIS